VRRDWERLGTVRALARRHGVSPGAAQVWLAEVGIFSRSRPAVPLIELQAAIDDGMSVRAIARHHRVDARVVRIDWHRLTTGRVDG
jgi:transposase-like protein